MLDWRAGYYADGTPIIQYPYCTAGYGPAEWSIRWVLIPGNDTWADEWRKTLVNRQTGRCLDADGPSGVQWIPRNQMWTIQAPYVPPR